VNARLIEALSLVLALFAAACSDDFDPSSRVSELRLLAVQADHPFALPGDDVHLTALAFDPEARPLTWAWGVCLEPSSSVALDCLRALSFDALTIAPDRTEHDLVVPETDAGYVGVAVVVCPGEIVRGDTQGVPLACVDVDGVRLPLSEFELGLKRINVREPSENENPAIAEVLWDGAPWPEDEIKLDACERTKNGACDAWTEHTVEVRAPGASEQSVDRDRNPVTEQAVVQMYATGGEFEDDVRLVDTAKTTWRARREDAGGMITFWFVVRDDRGGVSWVTRRISIP